MSCSRGPTKRKAFHILNRMESVGGEINAYTAKEDAQIAITFSASKDTERAPRIVGGHRVRECVSRGGIGQRARRDSGRKSRALYQDQPGDMIFESFEAGLFAGHALAAPILGTAERVKAVVVGRRCRAMRQRHSLAVGEHGAQAWWAR